VLLVLSDGNPEATTNVRVPINSLLIDQLKKLPLKLKLVALSVSA
jgi:hypothetical protein